MCRARQLPERVLWSSRTLSVDSLDTIIIAESSHEEGNSRRSSLTWAARERGQSHVHGEQSVETVCRLAASAPAATNVELLVEWVASQQYGAQLLRLECVNVEGLKLIEVGRSKLPANQKPDFCSQHPTAYLVESTSISIMLKDRYN